MFEWRRIDTLGGAAAGGGGVVGGGAGSYCNALVAAGGVGVEALACVGHPLSGLMAGDYGCCAGPAF